LRDHETGTWKAKYDGLDVSDARRLKALEDGNAGPRDIGL